MKTLDYKLRNIENTPWRLFCVKDDSKEYCVLWIQGWSSSMESHSEGVKRMAHKSGVTFATLDYAGHGLSNCDIEESTREQQLNEVIALFDELKSMGFQNITVVGGSFGGYMAALLVGKRPVSAVVLRAPAAYTDLEFDIPHKDTRKWHEVDVNTRANEAEQFIADNMGIKSLKTFDGFTYVLEHELDEQVPQIMPRAYYECARHGNYLIIPRTEHSPRKMKNPKPHFDYIEHTVVSIIEAIKLQGKIV